MPVLTSDNCLLSEPTTPPQILAQQASQPAPDFDAAIARYLQASISYTTPRDTPHRQSRRRGFGLEMMGRKQVRTTGWGASGTSRRSVSRTDAGGHMLRL